MSLGEDAVAAASDFRIDVAIVDPCQVDANVVALLASLGTAVVALAPSFDDAASTEAFRAGARGYLVKDEVEPEHLPAIVTLVHAGISVVSARSIEKLNETATRLRSSVTCKCGRKVSMVPELTERERDVYRYVAKGVTNAEIARALKISPATVKKHVGHIFDKLGIRSRVDLVLLGRSAENAEHNGHGTPKHADIPAAG
jgi:DNA-binding NarL/FixJ family response regulator